jgi:site-specific DNA-methyltransferase (adenine-specific)
MLTTTQFNPDVLSCLANLSNDEVFTPPKLANEMLDLLPKELWSNKDAKFLDPVCKTGIFLREVGKRLLAGLEKEIPNLQTRIDHIFKNQLYGIGITELTALMARRTLYCSKRANGKYSVVRFANGVGNISYRRTEHVWTNGRCSFCGASQEIYERQDNLESHAYQFIHKQNLGVLSTMRFDVIIGNPPYQLNDGGGMGTSAIPIYHRFVEQAKNLDPKYLCMVIPARWFSGGRGLDEFRDAMLHDKQVRKLVDYFDSNECFPGVDISGGVCYFLWESGYEGDAEITNVQQGEKSVVSRPLLEKGTDSFVRFNKAISILRKVRERKEKSFSSLVSGNDPFGFDVRAENSYKRIHPDFKNRPFKNSVELYFNGWQRQGVGFIDRSRIAKNVDWIGKHKIFIAKAYGERGSFPYRVISKPFYGGRNSCCTETYLVVGPFSTQKDVKNVISYMETRFFRFLMLLLKNTQNGMKKVYSFVPLQKFDEPWSDEKLYKRYRLTQEETDFIESMVSPIQPDLLIDAE